MRTLLFQGTQPNNLNRAKLYRPPTPTDYLPRARLLERLTPHPGQHLTLISASAGFGKTTLVSAWLAQSALPGAWLALDENDNDLVTFLSYLIAAVRTIFPNALRTTQLLVDTPTLPPLTLLANNLINELDALSEPFVLVLDDYHVIHLMAIHEILTELITYCPRPLHLVIATRFDPPLPLGRLRARQQMTELRTEDLRFTFAETHTLVQAVLGAEATPQAVETLNERAEGWVAGLRLILVSLRMSGRIQTPWIGLPARDRFLIDYLANEVLVSLPPVMQTFLLELSILERFNASLGTAVTGTRNSRANLHWLEANELFVVVLDEAKEWFRFHPLFQEFLRARLATTYSPEQIAELHRRASQWFAAQNLIEEALPHAITANDGALAADIVERHRYVLLDETHLPRLENLLRLLPPQIIDERPALLLSLAWVAWFRLRMPEIIEFVNRAQVLVDRMESDSPNARMLQGEVAAFRSYQAYWSGDFSGAQSQGEMALAQASPNFLHVRAIARLFLSAASQAKGNSTEAYRIVSEGVNEAGSDRISQLRNLLSALFIDWVNADLSRLRDTALSMLDLIKTGDHPQMLLWTNYFLGTLHYQRNELAEAERCLSALVEQRHLAHLNALTNGAFALALVYQAKNQPERASATLETLRSVLAESGNVALLSLVQAHQMELAIRQGRVDKETQWEPPQAANVLLPTPNFYTPSLTLPKLLLFQNTASSRQTALASLNELEQYNTNTHNRYATIQILALEALLYQAQGERAAALNALERAIQLAAPNGIVRVFADLGPAMGELLKQLYHRNVSRPFIEQILAALNPVRVKATAMRQPALAEPLTEREMKILSLLTEGLSNKEIAAHEILTVGTVKQYLSHIYQKLLVTNRRAALTKARTLGLVPSDQKHH